MERKDIKSNTMEKTTNTSLFSVSSTESPKKCNLSFSFNFDLDDVNSENSLDSETADLQIDVSEVDNYDPSSKHKRDADEETSVLNEMEEEIERQLDAKAAKTNLTATNVKNILKHVITNEHVMAMVQKRLHDAEEDIVFEPKLTRAKAKELAATQGNIPWPITPVKKASSEVQVLIEEELPEDSSDEEYNPEQDKQSDDDREAEQLGSSDIDSQPSTPANPLDVACCEASTPLDVQYDPEGIFKIPGIPHVPTEEESIGQRTRSKLCLSETPLEQIEQAFIPPDITTDMYDWDCEVDEDWDNFLKEFTQPLQQDPMVEDDPEADPEYNILEDEESDLLDKEELRADKAVKVTRKELNTLIAELFEFTDTFSKQEQEVSKKKKSVDNLSPSVENNTLNCSMVDLLPVLAEPELPKLVNLEQRHLLATQFRQHVQLMTQHFAMTYMHPELHSQSKTCKENLNSLRYLSNGPNSAFNAENLPDALKLVANWESKFLDPEFYEDYKKTIMDEENITKIYQANKWKYVPKFHPVLEKIFMESKALMYPHLLPHLPFKTGLNKLVKTPYLKSEENLLALGLEQFLPFVASKPRKFKGKKMQLMDAVQLIIQYLLPCRELHGVFSHIQRRRACKDPNPIKHYFEKGSAPRTIHYITLDSDPKAPKDQPLDLLPPRWQAYFNDTEQKIDMLKRKHILNSYGDLLKKDGRSDKHKYTMVSDNHPLRNPVVNILPKILPASTTQKSSDSNVPRSNSKTDKSRVPSGNSQLAKNTQASSSNLQTPAVDRSVESEEVPAPQSSFKDNIFDADAKSVQNEKLTEAEATKSSDTTSSRISKVSKKSQMLLSPTLRETTPRLAKIRSAQNMKLMAQVSGAKGISNSSAVKSRSKIDVKASDKSCVLPKLDNEDEIAELMLASTTIKKDSLSRKKAKQARELENIKRLLEAENPLHEEERDAKFAASYLQKLHVTLESSNPEVFRAVIKLYLDYHEKMDSINQSETDSCVSNESESSHVRDTADKTMTKDSLAINLYQSLCDKLKDYPELYTELLLFLKPHQAAMLDKSVEYVMLQKMSEFINVAQIYFAKQPSRLAKMMQGIAQLSSEPYVTLERVNAVISPILKGHPLVMDLFLQVLPTGKPPESLLAPHLFENLTCPLGPYDRNKVYTEDAPELYENIDLPVLTPQEDPYGGDNCKCNCHGADDPGLKNNVEHCVSCGTRFLNGRIYLQTTEGLRPAKITFPGADEEKLENIARVSLKTTDKFVPPPPATKQRRKSSKNDVAQDEVCQKTSPTKDNEESEKVVSKPKRGIKSPPKSGEQKKGLKRLGTMENIMSSKKIRTAQCKNKRERKIERRETKDQKEAGSGEATKMQETNSPNLGDSSLQTQDGASSDTSVKCKSANKDTKNSSYDCNIEANNKEPKATVKIDTTTENANTQKANTSGKCNNKNSECVISTEPWTRQEDMVLLQSIKKEYSENSFLSVSKELGNRTVDQVKERCQTLLSLLQKMA